MNLVKNEDRNLVLELINTLEMVYLKLKGDLVDSSVWERQIGMLKLAFHYFMMEQMPNVSKPKLPSEQQSNSNKEKKHKLSGLKEKGKQLTLFMLRYLKRILLKIVLYIEYGTLFLGDFLFKEEKDFENKIRQ